jgi:imidazoleglycerol-phosphate dehydratase
MTRKATISRKTKETQIELSLDLDGSGVNSVQTGVGFFDHMLDLLSKHALIDLNVQAKGDLDVDQHHTVEDVGICIGQALDKAVGDKKGIYRYGWAIVPMDEALAQVALDMSGRPALVFNVTFTSPLIGEFASELVMEFFQAIANNARMNLHINVPYGANSHHIAEAIFKGFAKALRQATTIDERARDLVPSTKGSLTI